MSTSINIRLRPCEGLPVLLESTRLSVWRTLSFSFFQDDGWYHLFFCKNQDSIHPNIHLKLVLAVCRIITFLFCNRIVIFKPEQSHWICSYALPTHTVCVIWWASLWGCYCCGASLNLVSVAGQPANQYTVQSDRGLVSPLIWPIRLQKRHSARLLGCPGRAVRSRYAVLPARRRRSMGRIIMHARALWLAHWYGT